MANERTKTTPSTDWKEKVGVDWSHLEKASQQHHKAGPHLEPTRRKTTGKAQEQLAEKHPGRGKEGRLHLEGDGEGSPWSSEMAEHRRWPMLRMGQVSVTKWSYL